MGGVVDYYNQLGAKGVREKVHISIAESNCQQANWPSHKKTESTSIMENSMTSRLRIKG